MNISKGNWLFFGDNLNILREHIPDNSIDIVYLDPPFNSKANYNILFQSPTGEKSDAQITAFEDTWHWNNQAEKEFQEIIDSGNTNISEMIIALKNFLKQNDMLAYLVMMTNRLIELKRVLKDTGSIYLHCDSTASHYLKIVMDTIFGINKFQNDIIWKRTTAHNDSNRFGRIHDSILFYSKSNEKVFNRLEGIEHSPEQLERYKYEDEKGKFKAENLTAPKFSETRTVEWKGTHPGSNRQWRYSIEELDRLYAEGKILLKTDGTPRKDGYKEYLHESKGASLQDIWTDINIGSTSGERLGYPTQKPLELLERIIQCSSNEGDLILDPFCGCGTSLHAAEKTKRRWIGIDITHLSIRLVEKRLKDAFPKIQFEVLGTPKDFDSAKNLAERDKYQFQWWACSLIDAIPYKDKKKGADGGIDGLLYFRDESLKSIPKKAIISVKGGNTSVKDIRDLKAVVDREKAQIGFFITLHEPTSPMITEAAISGFYNSPLNNKNYHKIQILTVEGLMTNKDTPQYPNIHFESIGFKEAKKEISNIDQQSSLF